MDAVILRQSVQLQMKELTRPGPWVGYLEGVLEQSEGRRKGARRQVSCTCTQTRRLGRQTYKCQLHGATEACRGRFIFFGPSVVGAAGQRDVGFGFIGGGGHDCVLLYDLQA